MFDGFQYFVCLLENLVIPEAEHTKALLVSQAVRSASCSGCSA